MFLKTEESFNVDISVLVTLPLVGQENYSIYLIFWILQVWFDVADFDLVPLESCFEETQKWNSEQGKDQTDVDKYLQD